MENRDLQTAAQRGFGETEAADQSARLRLEGAADVAQELEEIGLSAKTGWYASIVLYGAGGIVTAAFGLLSPNSVPQVVTVLAFFAILLSILSAIGSRFVPNADWATHVRLGCGLAIFLIGAIFVGPPKVAFVMLPLFVLITPAFLYGTRFSIPYASAVVVVMFVVLIFTPGPARIAHAWFTVGAMVMIVVSFMVAEQRTRSLARINRRLAYTDALTEIANTRRLRERLAEAFDKPWGEGQPFSLFAIDLDNFKLVNDTFDHSTGDRVLCAVARELNREVEAGDMVARRGGDEFSVFVEDDGSRDLDELTDRLAEAIARARRETCPQITPSGSVAYVRSSDKDTIASVLQRADDALHDAKVAFHKANGPREDIDVQVFETPSPIDRFTANRKGTYESVSAAVSRAYEPRSNSWRQVGRRAVDVALDGLRGANPLWGFASATMAPIGISVAAFSLAGSLSPLSPLVGGLLGAGIVSLAPLCLIGSRRALPLGWIHGVFMAAILFASTAIYLSKMNGAALVDIYPVLVLYSFYFFRPRSAVGYLVVCAALYGIFSLSVGYPSAGLRSGITITVMIVASTIVIKVRSVTIGFAKTNHELSEMDALTGVANLRALRSRVAHALANANSGVGQPVLVTVDLDKFKLVNDRYNHTVGDQVLEAVARAMSETVRVDELVARRGGDEFFILFERAEDAHIANVMPRLGDAIAHARARICPDLIPTASVGSVVWNRGDDVDAFMHKADLALHDEKIETRAQGYERQTA